MSKFSASDAAFVGFRLVREHPVAAAAWAVLMTVLSLALSIVTIQMFGPQFTQMLAMNGNDSATPEEMLALLGALAPLMIVSMLYSLALYSVLLAAVNRMVLRPDDSRSFYLRLGPDEWRQAGMLILTNLLLFGLYFAGALIYAVVLAIGVAAGGAIAGLTALLGFVALACALIYIIVRLSFASVITFDTGKISVLGSWAMTKGHVGALLGAYLLAVVMAVIVYLLIMVIVVALAVAVSGGISGLDGLFEPDMSSLEAFFTPAGMVRAAFAGLLSMLTTLIIVSPAPAIYQILRDGGVAAPSVDASV